MHDSGTTTIRPLPADVQAIKAVQPQQLNAVLGEDVHGDVALGHCGEPACTLVVAAH